MTHYCSYVWRRKITNMYLFIVIHFYENMCKIHQDSFLNYLFLLMILIQNKGVLSLTDIIMIQSLLSKSTHILQKLTLLVSIMTQKIFSVIKHNYYIVHRGTKANVKQREKKNCYKKEWWAKSTYMLKGEVNVQLATFTELKKYVFYLFASSISTIHSNYTFSIFSERWLCSKCLIFLSMLAHNRKL